MSNFQSFKVYQIKSAIEQWIEKNPNIKLPGWKNVSKYKLLKLLNQFKINPFHFDIPKTNPNPSLRTIIDARKKYNKKPYSEPEQESFLLNLNNNPRYQNPLQPLEQYVNKEGKKEYVSLQPHQIKFIKQFVFSNLRGTVAFHGVGSGKTLNAVVSSYYYLKMYPKNKVIVISPSSLLYNFTNGMIEYGLDIGDNRYSFFTYDKYIRNPKLAENALLIIDEAHNFRTEIIVKDIQDDNGNVIDTTPISNIRGYKIMKFGTHYAHKVLLLTGTAFVNSLYDIENLLAMIDNRKPISNEAFDLVIGDPDNLTDYFEYRISYYKTSPSNFFPDRIEKLIPLYMTEEQEKEYNRIEREGRENNESEKPNTFLSAERYASNFIDKLSNPKVKWILDEIRKKPNEKFIIYSGLYDAGASIIFNGLTQLKIGYKAITGRQTTTNKEESKRYYNGYNFGKDNFFDLKVVDPSQVKYINDKYRVLIITRAGAEGVDTINTQNIILMDSQWNDALSEQIIARAIRYKSHFGLPIAQRYVNVYRTLLMKQSDKPIFDRINSHSFNDWIGFHKEISEQTILRLKLQKMTDIDYLPTVKQLKELKIPSYTNGKLTGEEKFIPEKTEFKKFRMGFGKKSQYKQVTADGWDTYKAIDNDGKYKTSEEKDEARKKWRIKLYSQWYSTYGKPDVEKNLDNLKRTNMTSDLKMFILCKSKQKKIDDFISLFGKDIRLFESYQSKLLPYIIKEETRLNRQLTDEEQAKIYANLLKAENINILKTKYNPTTEIIGRMKGVKLQQYFTNELLAKYVIEKSSIKNNKGKIVILEPTAGEGALIKPIIELGKDTTIDLVEIDDKNRKLLHSIVDKKQNTLFLRGKNFLKYFISTRYDYIFTNPPFHLRKSENALLLKDVWDFDFVKRAFAFLKVGGELIAITSKKWMFVEEMKKWYKNKANKTFSYELKPNEKFSEIKIDVTIIKLVKTKEFEDNDILKIKYYKDQEIEAHIGRDISNNEYPIIKNKTVQQKKWGNNIINLL